MAYKRLNFNQYFIDSTEGTHNKGAEHLNFQYVHVNAKMPVLGFIKIPIHCEYYINYDVNRDVIQVFFQGTHGIMDWIINLLFKSNYYDAFLDEDGETLIQLKAARGWMTMWFAMKHIIRQKVMQIHGNHPTAEIELIGFSLGSALAQYCAQDINFNLGLQPYVYTTGSVKAWYGDRRWNKVYLTKCCKKVYNFQYENDIITRMPPFFGYYATNPVKIGKFEWKKAINPIAWWNAHFCYGDANLYTEITDEA